MKNTQIPHLGGKLTRMIMIVTTYNEKSNKIRWEHTLYIIWGWGRGNLGGREIGEMEVG